MTVKVEWDSSVPKRMKDMTQATVKKWLPILPGWLDGLFIIYEPVNEKSDIAWIAVSHEYRKATLTFSSTVGLDPTTLDEIVAHEFCHVLTNPSYVTRFITSFRSLSRTKALGSTSTSF